jgi:hypothetical protein
MARQFFNLNRAHEQMGDLEGAGKMVFRPKKLYGEAGKGAMAKYIHKQIHQLKNI